MQRTTFVIAMGMLTLPALAQVEFIGFSYNCAVGATSRGSIGTAAGEVMTRLDGTEHTGWGRVNWPVMERRIENIVFNVQDQDAATLENFDICLYPEDPLNPGYPDLLAPIVFATGVPGPTGTGIVANTRNINVPGGVGVPIANEWSDIFVSFKLPANAGWSATDGLSIHVVLGYPPAVTFLVWDSPSGAQGGPPNAGIPPVPAAFPANSQSVSHGLSRIGAGNANYDRRRHHLLEVSHVGSGGVGLAATNQTSFTSSNNPPPAGWGPCIGTASFMSGTNPDINGYNTGRADDISMEYFKTGTGTGTLVFFMMEFSGACIPERPISLVLPGSTGMICMANPQVTCTVPTVNDEACCFTAIPATLRPLLLGLPVLQQAAAFIVSTTGTVGIDLSPCDRMVF